MLKYYIPHPSTKILFETTLEPTTPAVDKLVNRKDMGEGEITMVQGKKNKVAIGVPYYENLISRLIEEMKKYLISVTGLLIVRTDKKIIELINYKMHVLK